MMSTRVVCFGELLLRLGAPGRELLLQSPQLDVHIGGAEANVAVSLAKFGHEAALISVIPDNSLGTAAVAEIRKHGVDTRRVSTAPGRMGLYFLTQGAMQRPSEVIYDRAASAFASVDPVHFDWQQLLIGADWLHVSGVTPALGERAAKAAIEAVQTAHRLGVQVSFDGNFRPKLWQAWQGHAPGILRQVMNEADVMFADHRDMAVVLETDFPQANTQAQIEAAAKAAFNAFQRLEKFATTIRVQHSVDHHSLSAMMLTRDGSVYYAQAMELASIVDRIGAGDAFAAGVLHGLISQMGDENSLRFGLAAACLKHSINGDFNLIGVDDVAACAAEERLDVRR
ncbi:MAG: PfkB family carbohydrate kinase [Arenimonas sp.]